VAIARATDTAKPSAAGSESNAQDLSPLDFLLSLMRDPETPPDLRGRVVRVVAPYVHPRPGRSPRPENALVIDDPFGFFVDLGAARALREDQLRLRLLERTPHLRPDDREQKELEASIVERKKALGWPRGYTKSDLAEDRTRLSHFWKKRKAPWPHNKLTEEEEAEEAHLAARSDAYYNSPEAIGESQARSRSLLIGLKFFSREPPATPEEISEFAKLRVLYPSVRGPP
jgi:hypothetical protein